MTTQPTPLSPQLSENALEQRARRAARRAGLIARKTRWRANSIDNFGGFMLVDERTNCVVSGTRFDMSAEEVNHRPSALRRNGGPASAVAPRP